ncbi:site-specific integrase [Polaromonas sp. DSR2-3-2]|uniref:site-specific integrase n=1 Tax=unclassified Polaromonas TaxID=2638319 RepID=UPI003CF760DF
MIPVSAALPLPLAPAPSGLAFFAAWKAARLADTHRKPMGASGLAQAEFVWGKWLAFCALRGIAWDAAGPADVQAFAGAVSPRKLTTSAQVSPITLRRYWRILNDLYAYAMLSRTLADNPCVEVMPAISEKTASLALPPHLWALLQSNLPGGQSFQARRNRLVLLLMMRSALTVTELLGLTLGCVQAHEGTPGQVARRLGLASLGSFEPESAFLAPTAAHPAGLTYTLALSGSRAVQTRCLVLDARTSAALHDWLEVRAMGHAGAGERLLVGAAKSSALSSKGLYKICRAHMARSLPGIEIDQMGPNTLRNTCIAMWLNAGLPLPEVQRRCGLKDASVIIRLGAHLQTRHTL